MAGTSDREDLLKTLVIDVAATLKGGTSGIPSLPTLLLNCSTHSRRHTCCFTRQVPSFGDDSPVIPSEPEDNCRCQNLLMLAGAKWRWNATMCRVREGSRGIRTGEGGVWNGSLHFIYLERGAGWRWACWRNHIWLWHIGANSS